MFGSRRGPCCVVLLFVAEAAGCLVSGYKQGRTPVVAYVVIVINIAVVVGVVVAVVVVVDLDLSRVRLSWSASAVIRTACFRCPDQHRQDEMHNRTKGCCGVGRCNKRG